jgi:hypothetical protein
MQIRLLPSFLLFLGSYFPLSVILLLQDISSASWELPICRALTACHLPELENPQRALSFFCVCAISLAFFLWSLNRFHGLHDMTVESSKSIPNDLINYVFPYVVSFMGLDFGSTGKFYGFLIFLLWMFLITYRSGQILMNPLLLVAGWQLYDVVANINGNIRNVSALSRTKLQPNDNMLSCVVQGIYVLSKPQKTKQ